MADNAVIGYSSNICECIHKTDIMENILDNLRLICRMSVRERK